MFQGWWAATVATYCPSRPGELPKSKSTQPRSTRRCVTLYVVSPCISISFYKSTKLINQSLHFLKGDFVTVSSLKIPYATRVIWLSSRIDGCMPPLPEVIRTWDIEGTASLFWFPNRLHSKLHFRCLRRTGCGLSTARTASSKTWTNTIPIIEKSKELTYKRYTRYGL